MTKCLNNTSIHKINDDKKRVIELETSLLYFSKVHADITHNLNSSIHKLLSYSFILGRNFDYLEDLILIYQDLSDSNMNSKIKEIKKFRDGVDVEAIKNMSTETVKSIELIVKQIHKDSKELHVMTREINHILQKSD
jgi:hypothetical protein